MKIFIAIFLLFGFTSHGLAADQSRDSQTDDIREAVFRWQFDHNGSGQQTNALVYFLEVGEKGEDPSDDFIKRFAGHIPLVRKASACKADRGNGVHDKKTGEQGLIFRIGHIDWKSDSEVDVGGGYYESGLSASGNTYTVKKQQGKWKVTKNTMHWIS